MKRTLGALKGVVALSAGIIAALGLFKLGELSNEYPVIGWVLVALLFAAAATVGALVADETGA